MTRPTKFAKIEATQLRDYFAGQVLVGLVLQMNSADRKRYLDGFADGREARLAYAVAESMLIARKTT